MYRDDDYEIKRAFAAWGAARSLRSGRSRALDIGMIAFTGSTAVGHSVGELAGRHLKKVVLELGEPCPQFEVTLDALPARLAQHPGRGDATGRREATARG